MRTGIFLSILIMLAFCAEAQNVEYAKPGRTLNGSYYTSTGNKVYFTIDGEYSTTNLVYTVYNYQRVAYTALPITSSVLNNGDNRYQLTVTTLPPGYYVLELSNQKNEKLYLRFKK